MDIMTDISRTTLIPPSVPSTPRLNMEPTGSSATLLDGGWWPRSTDPAAELPGLVPVIDRLRGAVVRLVLSADGWSSHPRRLAVGERVLRLDYFASQPASLLTAICDNGNRVDLLVVAPGTAATTAEAAIALAAVTSSVIHSPQILGVVDAPISRRAAFTSEEPWDGEGGQLGSAFSLAEPGRLPGGYAMHM
jgi:hypothetical protein